MRFYLFQLCFDKSRIFSEYQTSETFMSIRPLEGSLKLSTIPLALLFWRHLQINRTAHFDWKLYIW